MKRVKSFRIVNGIHQTDKLDRGHGYLNIS